MKVARKSVLISDGREFNVHEEPFRFSSNDVSALSEGISAFLVIVGMLSEVSIVVNSPNHSSCQSSSGGMRRGITATVVGSGQGFLLANGSKSTIGKAGEM